VAKWLDLDGDLSTTDDIVPAPGWTFNVDIENGTTDPAQGVTALDPEFPVALTSFDIVPGADGATVDVSEVLQTDFTFVDAVCYALDDGDQTPQGIRIQALADEVAGARGTVGDGAVTNVPISTGETVICEFVNTSGGVEAETATPRITPPPTATLPESGTPGGDSWRIVLLAIAGLLGTLLLLTPAAPTAVRRRR
jgi:hypothetical protein